MSAYRKLAGRTFVGAVAFVMSAMAHCQRSGTAAVKSPAEVKATYEAVTSKLDAGGEQFSFSNYEGDITGFFELVDPALKADGRVEIIGSGLKRGLVALGLDSVSIGSSAVPAGPDLETRKFYIRSVGRPGLFALAGDSAANPLESLRHLPANTEFFWAGRFEFSKVLPLLKTVAQSALGAAGPKMLDDQISAMEKETSVPFRKIMGSLGNEYCMYLVPPADASTTESQMVVKLKVTDDSLFQSLQLLKDMKLRVKALPDEGTVKVTSIEVEGDEVKTYFASYQPGWFTVSGNEKILRMSASEPSDKLADSSQFKELTKDMPDRVDAIRYVSSEYATTQLKNLRANLNTAFGEGKLDENENFPQVFSKAMQTLPDIIERSGFWGQSIAWRVNDADGILWVETGKPHYRMNATAVAGTGVVVAIAVPAFLRARESARGRACQVNLAILDGAKEQWALENKKAVGATPTMDDLRPYLSKTPVCPAGGTYHLHNVGEEPTCSYGDSDSPNAEDHKLN